MSDANIAVGSVASGSNMVRNIQMKFFAGASDHAKLGLLATVLKDKGVSAPEFQGEGGATNLQAAQNGVALGQIVGVIYSVDEKMGTLPDGSQKASLVATGDFEAVRYSDGKVITANTAYLPGYFAAAAQAMLNRAKDAASGVDFFVEIKLVPTGKSIPTAYEVVPMIARSAESPLNRLKQAAIAAGVQSRLPPPVATAAAEPLALPGHAPEREAPADAATAASGGEPEHDDGDDQGKPTEPLQKGGKGG